MKNKRWKREAKKLKGYANDFDFECAYCGLCKMCCKYACIKNIRTLEKECKSRC